jgi:hypothetical protein
MRLLHHVGGVHASAQAWVQTQFDHLAQVGPVAFQQPAEPSLIALARLLELASRLLRVRSILVSATSQDLICKTAQNVTAHFYQAAIRHLGIPSIVLGFESSNAVLSWFRSLDRGRAPELMGLPVFSYMTLGGRLSITSYPQGAGTWSRGRAFPKRVFFCGKRGPNACSQRANVRERHFIIR